MNAQKIIQLAEKHLGQGSMVSSAELCIVDAKRSLKIGAFESAKYHALKSIVYSVGICHPDYISAKEPK